jgi:iron complex transport system substrate-binding protein
LGRSYYAYVDPAGGSGGDSRSRVFLSPKLPYGWIDAPPSLNRLMGVRWLARLLFPGRFVGDIRDATRDFYHQFYQVDLSGAELDALLANPPEKR